MATTVSVDDITLERFNELKREYNELHAQQPDYNSSEFLDVLMETWEGANQEPSDPMQDVNTSDITNELAQEIDALAFDGAMSDEKADKILGRLDDLENSIPRKTAEELR